MCYVHTCYTCSCRLQISLKQDNANLMPRSNHPGHDLLGGSAADCHNIGTEAFLNRARQPLLNPTFLTGCCRRAAFCPTCAMCVISDLAETFPGLRSPVVFPQFGTWTVCCLSGVLSRFNLDMSDKDLLPGMGATLIRHSFNLAYYKGASAIASRCWGNNMWLDDHQSGPIQILRQRDGA